MKDMEQKHPRDMTDVEFAAAKSALIASEQIVRHAAEGKRALDDVLKTAPQNMTTEQVRARIAFELAAQKSTETP